MAMTKKDKGRKDQARKDKVAGLEKLAAAGSKDAKKKLAKQNKKK